MEAAQEVAPGRRNNFNVMKRKFPGGLALLSEDEGAVAFQAGHLAVDVQHLRLEKSGAVAGYVHGGFGQVARKRRGASIQIAGPGARDSQPGFPSDFNPATDRCYHRLFSEKRDRRAYP